MRSAGRAAAAGLGSEACKPASGSSALRSIRAPMRWCSLPWFRTGIRRIICSGPRNGSRWTSQGSPSCARNTVRGGRASGENPSSRSPTRKSRTTGTARSIFWPAAAGLIRRRPDSGITSSPAWAQAGTATTRLTTTTRLHSGRRMSAIISSWPTATSRSCWTIWTRGRAIARNAWRIDPIGPAQISGGDAGAAQPGRSPIPTPPTIGASTSTPT